MKVKFSVMALGLALVLAGSTFLVACSKTSTTDPAKPAANGEVKPITLRLVTEYSFADKRGQIVKAFAENVGKETNDKIKIEVYPDGQLFKSTEHAEAISGGSVDMAVTHFSKGWPNTIPELTVLGCAPFKDSDAALKALAGPLGDKLSKLVEEKAKTKVLAWTGAGNVDATGNTKRPITKPEDLKGLKMMVPSTTQVGYVEALGGVATVISPTERYLALQNGTADGMFCTTPSGAVNSKLTEPAKYWTRAAFATGVEHGFAINLAAWNKIPVDFQKIIQAEAKKSGEALIKDVQAIAEQEWANIKAGKDVQIYEVKPEELVNWFKVIEPARYKVLEKVVSKEVAKELLEMAAK